MPTPLLLVAGLVTFLPVAVSAQTGRITGSVLNASNNTPIGVAQIRIGDTGLGTVTGDNGRFIILNVPAGTHEVFAERIGFRTVSQMIQVSDDEAAVLEGLDYEPASVETIARRAGLTPEQVYPILLVLEIGGRVQTDPAGRYMRVC